MATEQYPVPSGSSIYVLDFEFIDIDRRWVQAGNIGIFNSVQAAKQAGINFIRHKTYFCTETYSPDDWVMRTDIDAMGRWYRFLTAAEPERELRLRAFEWIVQG